MKIYVAVVNGEAYAYTDRGLLEVVVKAAVEDLKLPFEPAIHETTVTKRAYKRKK
jgi:hypothetical protein